MPLLNFRKSTSVAAQRQILSYAGRAVSQLDSCIGYVTRPSARNPNAALGAVRLPVIFGFWTIVGFVLISIIWGSLVPIEGAASAPGSVVLYASKKTVQHLEGGVIDEILVKEGDKVIQGQKLIRLRDTTQDAARDTLQQQLYTERATQKRLKAELDKSEAVEFDSDLVEKSSTDADLSAILATQNHLFDAEKGEQDAKLAELNDRLLQAREEIKGIQSQSDSASEQAALLDKEIASVSDLFSKGYATETRLLTLQRNRSEVLGSGGQYRAQMAKSEQSIAESEMSIVNQEKEFEARVLKDLHDSQLKIVEIEDKLRSASEIEGRTMITAPSEGIVTGLRFHTPGGVIAPGGAVLDIVPQNEDLIIEARVKPSDVSAIQTGMDARIIFTSYKSRTTPRVPGKVTQISADVFTDDKANPPTSYYTARIEVDRSFIKRLRRPIELRPGLPVQVMIITGSRSFLGYLVKPVADSMYNAFREQ